MENQPLNDQHIVITGCCGSVGSALVRRLLTDENYSKCRVVGLDNSEDGIFQIEEKWKDDTRGRFYVADVRDRESLRQRFADADMVFHCAALKHVYQCEKAPSEAVNTNILGVESVIAAARDAGVRRVLFTSSDKAVNPTNVMGTSKLMGERLITAANASSHNGAIFASTRFGNVLGSRGSVIEVFRRQIASGGPVTLTSPEMTRFVMNIEQAVALVLGSVSLARGGEVFITKMPVIYVKDLAQVMIKNLAPRYGHDPDHIQICVVGARPGEKMYEELLTGEETRRAVELEEYFVVRPAFTPVYSRIHYEYPGLRSENVTRPYVSAEEPKLTAPDIQALLDQARLLDSLET
ncbi:MAG TPA: polysaccharide biosynthesis protein [Gammaproteobacteria bacterium]|nr:polysaccharide biosynthesis protein [Gammaproteobacteria bacterium]